MGVGGVPAAGVARWYLIRYHLSMDTGALVATARRRAHLGVRGLARRSGTSHATLLAYERGRVEPSASVATRVVAAAGFVIEARLRAVPPGSSGTARSQEVVDVLTLAEALPRRRRSVRLDAPIFPGPSFGQAIEQ